MAGTPQIHTTLLSLLQWNVFSVVDIVAGKQLTTFQTGKKPDRIGWETSLTNLRPTKGKSTKRAGNDFVPFCGY